MVAEKRHKILFAQCSCLEVHFNETFVYCTENVARSFHFFIKRWFTPEVKILVSVLFTVSFPNFPWYWVHFRWWIILPDVVIRNKHMCNIYHYGFDRSQQTLWRFIYRFALRKKICQRYHKTLDDAILWHIQCTTYYIWHVSYSTGLFSAFVICVICDN